MAFKNLLRTFAIYVAACAVAISGTGLMRLPVAIAEVDADDLVINEISWGSSSTQWIELYNPGSVAVDLAETPYTLHIDKAGVTVGTVNLDGSQSESAQTIGPKHYLLLSYVPAGKVSTLQVSRDVALDTALPTENARYILKNEGGETVDQADNGNTLPIAGADRPVVASMYRQYPFTDGTQKAAWGTSQTVGTGFTSAAQEYGTPQNSGSVNTSATFTNPEVAAPTDVAIRPSASGMPNTEVTGLTGLFADKSMAVSARITHTNILTNSTLTLPAIDVVNPEKPFVAGFHLVPGLYRVYVHALDAQGNRSADVLVRTGATAQAVYAVYGGEVMPDKPVLAKYTEGDPGFSKENNIVLEGTTEAGSVIITVNNAEIRTLPVNDETDRFFAQVTLLPNQKNVIEVRSKIGASISEPAFAVVYQDTTAPVLDRSKITLTSNRPGVNDSIQGVAGAVQDVTLGYGFNLKACADAACTTVIAPNIPVKADGSFAAEIGDNQYATVYLVATDRFGYASEAMSFENTIAFTVAGGIPLTAKVTGTDSMTLTWSPVTGAVGYRLKYMPVGGSFGEVVNVCFNTPTCTHEYVFSTLLPNTPYVFAIAAVDVYGNETAYTETRLSTSVLYDGVGGNIPAPVQVAQQTQTPSSTRVMPTPDVTGTPSPEVSPTPAPEEEGDVKSAETDANDRNWTPWIILAILVGLAILAITGYFYWFGGEAGEEALKSAEAEKKADAAKEAAPAKGTEEKADTDEKKSSKRW